MGGGGGGGASGPELSTDNMKGIVLALLSSGFIGASFIIKKKGLRRAAAATGVRAGRPLPSRTIDRGCWNRPVFWSKEMSTLVGWERFLNSDDGMRRCRRVLLPHGAPVVGWHDH